MDEAAHKIALENAALMLDTMRKDLSEKKELTDTIENALKQALNDFKTKEWKK